MKREEVVNRIKQSIKKRTPDAIIILYGSEARGESSPSSDIDVLILLDRVSISRNEKSDIMDILYDIELETGVLISPLIYSLKEWENRPFKTPFYINVVNEGIML